MARFLTIILCLLAFPALAAQESKVMLGGVQGTLWKPDSMKAGQAYPLIVFSHGLSGCPTQSEFLTQGLADAGYIVLAPLHADAGCGKGKGFIRSFREHRKEMKEGKTPDFQNPASWNDESYADRRADVENLLDAAEEDKQLGPLIDRNRVGIAGHSLGGYTALGLAGAWPSWKDSRFKAILALSPYAEPFRKGKLGSMNVPVMYQGGTRDSDITPYVKKPGGVYDLSSVPKYFVEFDKTGHFGWTDMAGKDVHDAMLQYATAFFGQYLLQQNSPVFTQKLSGVTDLRSK